MTILIGVLIAMAGILGMVGGILLIVAAFRQSPLWGIAVLFVPFAALVFLFKYWEAARRPFLIQLAALVVGGAGVGLGVTHGIEAMQQLALQMSEQGLGGTNAESFLVDIAAAMGPADMSPANAAVNGIAGPNDLVGLGLEDVKTLYGRPRGEMSSRGRTSLLYAGFTVFSDDSETVEFVQVEPGAENQTPTGTADVAPVRAAEAASSPGPVVVIRRRGARVNLKDLLVPGHITVVDFFADWCGPCRQIAPDLDRLAQNNPRVVLRKVDIVNWKSPVCAQYGIRSVPNMRVYDALGHMIGEPTASLSAVRANVARAK